MTESEKKIQALEDKIEALQKKKRALIDKKYKEDKKAWEQKILAENAAGIEFSKTLVGKWAIFGGNIIKHNTFAVKYDYVSVYLIKSVLYYDKYNISISGKHLYTSMNSAEISDFQNVLSLEYLNGTYKPGPNEIYHGGINILEKADVDRAFAFYEAHSKNIYSQLLGFNEGNFCTNFKCKMDNFSKEEYDRICEEYRDAYKKYKSLKNKYHFPYGMLIEHEEDESGRSW